ncbi:MAG: helix-turn-helix domain-containing protein [Saprospiraceae bacterium]
MDDYAIVSIITLFLIFLSVLLVIFLITVKNGKRLTNRLLATYFFIFATHISVFFYINYIELPTVLERLRDQIMFLSSPLLYLYLIASIYADFKLKPKHLWHFAPFLIDILIFTPNFYMVAESERIAFLQSFSSSWEAKCDAIFAVLVSAFYLILMFRELKIYQQILQNNFSNQVDFNYRWLRQFTILLTIIFLVSQIKQVYLFLGDNIATLNILYTLLTLSLLLFLTWIVFQSLYHPELFRNITNKEQLQMPIAAAKNKQSETTDWTKEATHLQDFMQQEVPYLDDSLTLEKLANQVNLPPRTLSLIINQHFQQRFFEFVNEYRIQKAMDLLKNTDTKMTVQQIMYEVGFNSKSSFYTAFRKQTAQTPSQYRKNRRNLQ